MRTLLLITLSMLLVPGCGEDAREDSPMVMEETGTIEPGDLTDVNHAGLPYDPYDFPVRPLDNVTVEIEAEGFDPMLKLVEVSTGAVLAEWDSQYTDQPALTYRIAGGGTCQARVYALEHGTGSYSVTITVTR